MKYTTAVLVAVAIVCAAGCSDQTIDSANKDVQRDVNTIATQAKPKLAALDIGARVTAALTANSNLPHTIRVDASPNGVRLSGTVHTANQKHLAGEIAKQTIKPDQHVDNELQVNAS